MPISLTILSCGGCAMTKIYKKICGFSGLCPMCPCVSVNISRAGSRIFPATPIRACLMAGWKATNNKKPPLAVKKVRLTPVQKMITIFSIGRCQTDGMLTLRLMASFLSCLQCFGLMFVPYFWNLFIIFLVLVRLQTIWYFLLNTNIIIDYPLLKRIFGKLAIGQSINFTNSCKSCV